MITEIKPLELLIDRKVLEIETDISTTIPLNDKDPDHIQIEIPLRLSFDFYTLHIFNRWAFISETLERPEELKGHVLTNIQMVAQTLELQFNSANVIRVDMSDAGFIGPEALVLSCPGNLTVVWN